MPAATPRALAGVGIDTTFGQGGTAIPELEQTWESSGFSEVAAQPDGGAVVRFEPVAVNSLAAQAMRRYRGDGSLDPSYVSPIPPPWTVRATQEDGKVLIAQPLSDGKGEFIVRLNSDGTRDGTFGTGGSSSSVPFAISAISFGSSGTILVAGSVNKSYTGMHGNPSVSLVEPFVARFSSNGHLDPSFASGGVVNLHSAGGIEGFPREVQEGPDGKAWLSVRSLDRKSVV